MQQNVFSSTKNAKKGPLCHSQVENIYKWYPRGKRASWQKMIYQIFWNFRNFLHRKIRAYFNDTISYRLFEIANYFLCNLLWTPRTPNLIFMHKLEKLFPRQFPEGFTSAYRTSSPFPSKSQAKSQAKSQDFFGEKEREPSLALLKQRPFPPWRLRRVDLSLEESDEGSTWSTQIWPKTRLWIVPFTLKTVNIGWNLSTFGWEVWCKLCSYFLALWVSFSFSQKAFLI